jgi:hypothetical protein
MLAQMRGAVSTVGDAQSAAMLFLRERWALIAGCF